MAGLFKSLKRVMTGEIVQQIDIPIMNGNCDVSLRLKYDSGNRTHYVVLAGIASGNHQYYAFELDEVDAFLRAAETIRNNPRLLEQSR